MGPDEEDAVDLRDCNSGKCLDESRDHQPADGTVVYLYTCLFDSHRNLPDNQLWYMETVFIDSRPFFQLRNAYDHRCLDIKDYQYVNGADLQVWSCTGAWNQAWLFGG